MDTSKESVRGVGCGALGSGKNVRGYRNTPFQKEFKFMKDSMDPYGKLIVALLLPGVPGGLLTEWVVDKLRKVQPATGQLEEFFFFTMAWAAIFWVSLAIFLFCKFAL